MKKTTTGANTPIKTKKDTEKVVPLPVTAAETNTPETTPATVRTVDTVTLEIVTLKRQAGQVLMGYAIEIGRRLVEVKEMLPHGTWGDYLKNRVEYSQSTADNFMKLFREYGASQTSLFGAEANSQTLANLPYSKALALLALPSEEREEFAAENDVESMSTRELQAALRAKAEAEASAKSAEESRAKMEADMRAANEHMTAAKEEAEAARAAQEAAEAKAAALLAELEELEKRPIDVAVEAADPMELDRAREEGRQEAEKELRSQVADAEKAKEIATAKAREELDKARAAAKEAKEAGKRREEELAAAREEAARLKKALEANSSKDVTEFGVRFQGIQTEYGGLVDCLGRIRKAGDVEHHDKLVGALEALIETLKGQVPERVGGAAS